MSEKVEIPEEMYKSIVEHSPADANQFTPVSNDIELPNTAPERVKVSDLAKAENEPAPEPEPVDDTTTTEPPAVEPEPGNDVEVEEQDLEDGLIRRKVNGVWNIVEKVNGKEELVPQRDWIRAKQSEKAITQGFQGLRERQREFDESMRLKEQALEEERQSIQALNALFAQPQPQEPQATSPFDDLLGTQPTQPAQPQQHMPNPEVVALQKQLADMSQVVNRLAPVADQMEERKLVNAAITQASGLLSEFGLEAPKDWEPVANQIALECNGDMNAYTAALKDPVRLARAAKSFQGTSTPQTKDVPSTPTTTPPTTTTVHKSTTPTAIGSQIKQMEAKVADLQKRADGREGEGPDSWKVQSALLKATSELYELQAQKYKEG